MADKPFPGCEERIHQQNPKHKICSVQHCSQWDITDSYHDSCPQGGDPLKPVSINECLKDGQSIDVKWNDDDGTIDYNDCFSKGGKPSPCWCCCACFAVGTPVSTSAGMKRVELFEVGDDVSSGSIKSFTSGKLEIDWQPQKIQFSNGTGGGDARVLSIHYAKGKKLVSTPDQLFLLSSGKLQRADKLVPLKDKLVSAYDGKFLDIDEIHPGHWKKGLHHIATTLEFNDSLDGHLLNTNGVVVADYCLQIHQKQLSAGGFMKQDPALMATVATEEYRNENTHVTSDMISPFGEEPPAYIPQGAAQFFTADQANDIRNNAKFNNTLYRDREAVNNLHKIYGAFFPDISFYLDQYSKEINVYSFEIYGRKQVVFSGRILDIDGLYYSGYAFLIAQAIARLLGDAPFDRNGLTYAGVADFHAGSFVMRRVFLNSFENMVYSDSGIADQMKMLFSYISDDNKKGDPQDLADYPAADCRIRAIQNGLYGGNIPACTNPGNLMLTDIKTNSSGSMGEFLNLTFNMDIDHDTAEDMSNYVFSSADPGSADLPRLLTASVSLDDSKVVELRVQALFDKEYTLTVHGIKSTNGSTLDLQHNSQKFKFKS